MESVWKVRLNPRKVCVSAWKVDDSRAYGMQICEACSIQYSKGLVSSLLILYVVCEYSG